jgi:hypothetical protein
MLKEDWTIVSPSVSYGYVGLGFFYSSGLLRVEDGLDMSNHVCYHSPYHLVLSHVDSLVVKVTTRNHVLAWSSFHFVEHYMASTSCIAHRAFHIYNL